MHVVIVGNGVVINLVADFTKGMAESSMDKLKCPVSIRQNQVKIDNLSSNARNLTLTNVNCPDNSLNELLASVSDVNRRLQNVDKVNKKLRQQHQDMSKENRNQKEQLSTLFQENCSLQEKVARLDIENRNFKKRTAQLEEENQKLIKFIKSLQKKGPLDGTSIPGIVNNVVLLGKRHSSPPTFTNNDRVDKATSLNRHKEVASDSLVTSSGTVTPPDFSLLDIEVPEELMVQEVDVCLNNMGDLKRDMEFVNYNLKYMLHLCFSSKIKGNSHTKSLNPVLIGRGGGDFPSVDSLEASFPAIPRDDLLALNSDPTQNLLKLIPNQPDKARTTQYSNKLQTQEKTDDDDILQGFFKRRQLQWANPTFVTNHSQIDYDLIQSKLNEIEGSSNDDFRPVVQRSVSSEVVVSSPPNSSILTPDSLSSLRSPLDEEYSHLSSVLLKEERVCPICNVVFPQHVPQIDFERHAASHFDLEEFELITS